jgi:hypothetical protein
VSELHAVNPTGLLAHYAVDLLFEGDAGDLDAVTGDLEDLERRVGDEAGLVLRHRQPLERGAPPEWTLGEATPIDRDALEPLVAQSWWWRDAAAVAARCTHARRLADHLFVTLDHRRRIRQFHRILAAAVEALPCRALAWWPSQQVIAPDDFLGTMRAEGLESPAPGALNVRLFRLGRGDEETGEGAFLMDTLGLGALGLLDLQCRFRGLDPHEVSHVLQATGIYLWQHGPVIRSGDSVQGLRPTDRWRCRAQRSAAEPERELLDLDPGFPFGLGDAT